MSGISLGYLTTCGGESAKSRIEGRIGRFADLKNCL